VGKCAPRCPFLEGHPPCETAGGRHHRGGRQNPSSRHGDSSGRGSRPAYHGSPGRHLRSAVHGDPGIAPCPDLGRVTYGGLDWFLHHAGSLGSNHRLGGLWSALSSDPGLGPVRGRGTDAAEGEGQRTMRSHGEPFGGYLHPGCGSVGGSRGHGHDGHHLSVFAQHDFLQEMVSASLWAEPFLVSVTVAQQDVTGGEKYFWKRSTLVSALDGMLHAVAPCVDGGDGCVCDAEVGVWRSTSRKPPLQMRDSTRRAWRRRGDKTGRSIQCRRTVRARITDRAILASVPGAGSWLFGSTHVANDVTDGLLTSNWQDWTLFASS
jgi:hypothetical protein